MPDSIISHRSTNLQAVRPEYNLIGIPEQHQISTMTTIRIAPLCHMAFSAASVIKLSIVLS